MEATGTTPESPKKKTAPVVKKNSAVKKLDLESAKILQAIKDKANKKSFGRKVRDAEILAVAIKLVTADHIRDLQEATYSERDRLNMVHEDYQKAHGKISLDQFIGKLLKGEVQTSQNKS